MNRLLPQKRLLGPWPIQQQGLGSGLAMAVALEEKEDYIINANAKDLKAGGKGLSAALLDRLALDSGRVALWPKDYGPAILTDPVGEIISMWRRPNGYRWADEGAAGGYWYY